METLPPLCLECIAEHLVDSYGYPEPMLGAARDAGNFARVSRWFRESFTLPLCEFINMQLEGKPAELANGLGCTIRQPVRNFLMADAKEPDATVTNTEALGMGLTSTQLSSLRYELERGFPRNEQDLEPFQDEDILFHWADWRDYGGYGDAPMRKYRKCDVLEMLMNPF